MAESVCAKKKCKKRQTRQIIHKLIGYKFPCYPIRLTRRLIEQEALLGRPPPQPPRITDIYVGAAVESTIATSPTNPQHIVAAWQQNRINNGGSVQTGTSHSEDGGRCWKTSSAPFPKCLEVQRVSDHILTYDINGNVVYLTMLYINSTLILSNGLNQGGVAAFVSHDNGATWRFADSLVTSASFGLNPTPPDFPPDYPAVSASQDKPNSLADRFRSGVCRVVFTQFPLNFDYHGDSWISETFDYGKTWSSHLIYDPFNDQTLASNGNFNSVFCLNNTLIQLRKKRQLLNFFSRTYATINSSYDQWIEDEIPFPFTNDDICFIRRLRNGVWETDSTIVIPTVTAIPIFTGGYVYSISQPPNGGITGGVGTIVAGVGPQVRSGTGGGANGGTLFSVAVNPKNDYLYVACISDLFRPDKLFQIVLTWSRDGGRTWSPQERVNQTPQDVYNPQAFTPALAVTSDGFIGIVYNDFRFDTKNFIPPATTNAQTLTDTWLAIYRETETGIAFVREVRLTPQSFIMQNGPLTSQGLMASGDYSAILASSARSFYTSYTTSLAGPFSAPFLEVSDPDTGTIVLVDKNDRNQVFFANVPVCK